MRDAPGTSNNVGGKTNGDIRKRLPEININPKHTKRIYELATGERVKTNLKESQLKDISEALRILHAIIDDPGYEYSKEMQVSLRAHFGKFDRELPKQEEAILEEARKYVVFSYGNPRQRDEMISAMKQIGIVGPEPKDNDDGSGNIYISDMHRHSTDEQKDISHNIELIRLTKLFLYAWRRDNRRKELVALKEDKKKTQNAQDATHSLNLGHIKTPPEYEFLQPPIPGKDKTKTGAPSNNILTDNDSTSTEEFVNFEEGDAWNPDLVDDFSQRERDFYEGLDVSKEDYERVIELAPVYSKDLILAKNKYAWRVVDGKPILYRKNSHNKFEEVGVLQQLNMFLQAKEALVTYMDGNKPNHLLRADVTKEQKEALMQVLLISAGLIINNAKRRHKHFGGDIDNLTQEAWLGLIEALKRADIERTDDEKRARIMILRLTKYIRYYIHKRMRSSNFAEGAVITRPVELSNAKARYHNIMEAIAKKNDGEVDRKLLANELLKQGIIVPHPYERIGIAMVTSRKRLTDGKINNISDEVKAKLLDDFERMINVASDTVPLEDVNEENEPQLQIMTPHLDVLEKKQLKEALNAALRTLTPREERILRMYFGIGDLTETKTMQEIADEFNLSDSRIHQIKQRALKKLNTPHDISRKRLKKFHDAS